MKLILGSASKSRQKILREIGCEFDVIPADIDEKAIRDSDPEKLVLRLAHAKADAILPKLSEPAMLVTSDQVIVFHDEIREKPESEEQARAFLQSYRNEKAWAVTSVVVTNTETGERYEGVDTVTVHFFQIPDENIEAFIASGRPFELAGGFAVQDSLLQDYVNIEGETESIIGLPKALTLRLLDEAAQKNPVAPGKAYCDDPKALAAVLRKTGELGKNK